MIPPHLIKMIERFKHIGVHMAGVLTCEDGTRWHPTELLMLVKEIEEALSRNE